MVEPFNDRIMKKCLRTPKENDPPVNITEIELYESNFKVISLMNTMLCELFKIDKFISNNLKEWISLPLVDYIKFLKNSQALKIKF